MDTKEWSIGDPDKHEEWVIQIDPNGGGLIRGPTYEILYFGDTEDLKRFFTLCAQVHTELGETDEDSEI